MKNRKVSVIVPVYNAEKYLEGCIQSILNQDYKNVELVLINDGSIDHSGTICEEYANKYPNIIYKFQENAGVSGARNRGIDTASGEYVMFVDSDDRIKINMISSLVEALENADADLSICGYEVLRGDGVTLRCIDQETVSGKENIAHYFADHFCEAIASSACCKLYRRSLILRRFHAEISMGEDLLFNLGYVRQIERVIAIPETLYIYDKTNDCSLTHNYKEVYHKSNLYVFEQWLGWLHDHQHVNDVNVHLRIVNSYLAKLYAVCTGVLPGNKLQLIKSMFNDEVNISIQKAMPCFGFLHRIVLQLIVHRRYQMVLLVGSVYCKVKNRHRS